MISREDKKRIVELSQDVRSCCRFLGIKETDLYKILKEKIPNLTDNQKSFTTMFRNQPATFLKVPYFMDTLEILLNDYKRNICKELKIKES
jgi:hypothetical protein